MRCPVSSLTLTLFCLNRNDVITAQVSDHQPLIYNGVLFWNIMMQGKKRANGDYNNGFGTNEIFSRIGKTKRIDVTRGTH